MGLVGFMQGRLSPLVNDRIQAFPWDHWREEFSLAETCRLSLMEWTLDQDRLHENPLMIPKGRKEIRGLMEIHGVRITSLTCDCFMQAPFFNASGLEYSRLLDDLKNIIEACADMRIEHVVIPLVDNGHLENAQQEDSLKLGLEGIISVLSDAGIKIVFESDFPPERLGDFITSFPEETFGINYDIGNSAALGFDSAEEITNYGKRIYNVHVKDRVLKGTTVPLGAGNADFPVVFRLLKKSGYSGNYILQTARAADDDHAGILCRYRDMTENWLRAA